MSIAADTTSELSGSVFTVIVTDLKIVCLLKINKQNLKKKKRKKNFLQSHMLSVFCASHSRLHWPVALRWRASLSSSICSRSFFQRRYSALSLPVMDMVMSTEAFGPGLRLCRDNNDRLSQ